MRLTRQRHYVIVLFLVLAILVAQTSQVTCETYAVNGFEIQTRLVPDKSTIMLGEPVYVSYIVDNLSEQDFDVIIGGDYRNRLGRKARFTVIVQGEDNRQVPQPDAGLGMGGTEGPRKVPAGGNHAFRLFLPHWATFQEVGNYTMVAKRILVLIEHGEEQWLLNEKSTRVKTEATTKFRIVPLDEAKMGDIINRLGSAMFSKYTNESEEASDALDYIKDERVIPYLIRASETNRYVLKFSALSALSKFDSESAFKALQKGLEKEGEDNNIYHVAAGALARSPHPGAVPYLLSKRQHPYEGVRLTILHAVGKMKPNEAIPILREMIHDEYAIIRTEAKRYLKLISKKNSASQH
ncbi:MAG: HEAT repeat domain-containing protein [Candidatus Poribacteria bacterium]|nr:HEAT repeat domain-containing protein [Candidatus Poribacteria bacterium]MDE0503023.1 HEAT repeat domain-containing protein [Candidatus Poribacteria bacterium]